MSFWWLAVKDLLLIGRDKKALLTLIAMPLLLISILGAAFGNLLKEGEDVTIKKFSLGVVNLDEGPLGKVLANEVFAKGLSKQIRVKVYDEVELKKKIKDQKLSVGIVINSDFTASLMSGKETKVKMITVPNPGIKGTIVQSVIEQFSQTIAVQLEAAKLSFNQSNQGGTDFQSIFQNLNMQEMSAQMNQKLTQETTVEKDTKPVGSFQYYAAAMGVMFLLLTVVEGVGAMILEKEQEVYKRLLVSNLSYANYLFGKLLGLIILCLLQAFIIIIGTKLIFGVDWGESVAGVILMTITYVISACGLGVLAGSFIKKEKSFAVAGMFGSQVLAAMGGSMAPIYIFPDWAVTIMKVIPNGLALQTYLDLMSGGTLSDVLLPSAGAFGLGILFFAIGLARLSLERRGSYA
jgi:ABC-2 type transport system permease protein